MEDRPLLLYSPLIVRQGRSNGSGTCVFPFPTIINIGEAGCMPDIRFPGSARWEPALAAPAALCPATMQIESTQSSKISLVSSRSPSRT